jgi:hypothetical protein
MSLDITPIPEMAVNENEEVKHPFIENQFEPESKDSLCLRYIRNKYYCTIIYCLILLVMMQIVLQVIEKLDNDSINMILSYFKQNNGNLMFNSTLFPLEKQ